MTEPSQGPGVKLGLTDLAQAMGDGEITGRMILQDWVSVSLAGGLWLRRARVMGR